VFVFCVYETSSERGFFFWADGKTSVTHAYTYRVATISRLLKITGLLCKRDLQKGEMERARWKDFCLYVSKGKDLFQRPLSYGVATISRLLKIGLFCKRDLQKRPIFSKETYTFKEPTNRSHPIGRLGLFLWKRSLPLEMYTPLPIWREGETRVCTSPKEKTSFRDLFHRTSRSVPLEAVSSFGDVHTMGWLMLVGSLKL